MIWRYPIQPLSQLSPERLKRLHEKHGKGRSRLRHFSGTFPPVPPPQPLPDMRQMWMELEIEKKKAFCLKEGARVHLMQRQEETHISMNSNI